MSAALGRRNFLIVTHGDCIGSVMGIMPELQEKMVEKAPETMAFDRLFVRFLGGLWRLVARGSCGSSRALPESQGNGVLASRKPKKWVRPWRRSYRCLHRPFGSYGWIKGRFEAFRAVPLRVSRARELFAKEEELIGQEAYSPFQERLERVEEALEDLDQWATPVEKKELKLSQQAMSGWQCETLNIVTRSKATSRSSKLAKRLAALVEPLELTFNISILCLYLIHVSIYPMHVYIQHIYALVSRVDTTLSWYGFSWPWTRSQH